MEIQGLAYPLKITESGNLRLDTGADLLSDHIRSWLETEPFERLGAEWYGTPDYTFNSYPEFASILTALESALTANVAQAKFSVSGNLNGRGEATIEVRWSYLGLDQNPLIVMVST